MKILEGKRGLIFGVLDRKSLAWQVALEAKKQGAVFVLTNTPVAIRLGEINTLAAEISTRVLPADATNVAQLEVLFEQTMSILGGKIDFILHSIGMSYNVRKNRPYTDLDYNWFVKGIDVSALSFHKLLQVAKRLDAISQWGSVVALTYIAAQRTFPGYNDMANSKALLESIARSFGYHYGKSHRVRINTVSQSPARTTAGVGINGFETFYKYADKTSPLGNASAQDCARYCVVLFSDMCRMVTMQNLYHDGGFATTGMIDTVD